MFHSIITYIGVSSAYLCAICDLAAATEYRWVQATEAAPWSGREQAAVAVFQNKIWLIGGTQDGYDAHNDVWCSEDGTEWTEVCHSAPWMPRFGHGVVSSESRLWVLGGRTSTGAFLNDVWFTEDGVTWVESAAHADWEPRSSCGVTLFTTTIFVMGGYYPITNDIWVTSVGKQWVLVAEHAPWVARHLHRAETWDDKLWLSGGLRESTVYTRALADVWCTYDGLVWTEITAQAPWHSRCSHGFAAFNTKLWVFGGGYWAGSGHDQHAVLLNDVWSTTDGADRTQVNEHAPWSARWGFASTVFRNRLWVLGGRAQPGPEEWVTTNDVWYMEAVGGEPTIEGNPGWLEAGEALSLRVNFPAAWGDETYAWYKDGAALADETGMTLDIPSVTEADTGAYWCVVTRDAKAAQKTNRVHVQVVAAGALPAATLPALLALLAATGLRRCARPRIGG